MYIGMHESEAGALVTNAMTAAGLRNAFALSLFAGVYHAVFDKVYFVTDGPFNRERCTSPRKRYRSRPRQERLDSDRLWRQPARIRQRRNESTPILLDHPTAVLILFGRRSLYRTLPFLHVHLHYGTWFTPCSRAHLTLLRTGLSLLRSIGRPVRQWVLTPGTSRIGSVTVRRQVLNNLRRN